jgi:GWxTD domain-containing protein
MYKTTILFLLSVFFLHANGQITAYFSRCSFNTPENKPYIETYLSVLGSSVSFKKNANGKFQGVVEVGILFSKEGQIKASKKYNLLSSEVADTLNKPPFIDQQRFQLDVGMYDLEIMITDKNIKGKTFSMKEKINLTFLADKVSISDIEFLASFSKADVKSVITKNGFDLIPYASDFFPENIDDISFYAEVYNTNFILGGGKNFLINYYIERYEGGGQLPKYVLFKKETTQPVNALLSTFHVSELQSGNYNLVVDVRDKNNELVAQRKKFFQRRSVSSKGVSLDDLSFVSVENTFVASITGVDTLSEALRALRPIASIAEKRFLDNQLKGANEKLMKQFFYNFWQSRSQTSPDGAWNKYSQEVKAVNSKFGMFSSFKGYETERGRVYLQYGPPDKMELHPKEPNAYPYEIWVYYRLVDRSKLNPMQTNRQFVFFNRDLVSDNYVIIHSNVQGELNDSNWEMKLYSRTVQSNDFDHNSSPNHFGGNAKEEFRNPH